MNQVSLSDEFVLVSVHVPVSQVLSILDANISNNIILHFPGTEPRLPLREIVWYDKTVTVNQ